MNLRRVHAGSCRSLHIALADGELLIHTKLISFENNNDGFNTMAFLIDARTLARGDKRLREEMTFAFQSMGKRMHAICH